jgi:hypothetical protein
LKGTHQHLVCGDDDNLLVDNKNITKKNTKALLDAGKEVGLEVTQRSRLCMFMSFHQSAGQNKCIQAPSKNSENMAKFKYLGATATNQITFTNLF